MIDSGLDDLVHQGVYEVMSLLHFRERDLELAMIQLE